MMFVESSAPKPKKPTRNEKGQEERYQDYDNQQQLAGMGRRCLGGLVVPLLGDFVTRDFFSVLCGARKFGHVFAP